MANNGALQRPAGADAAATPSLQVQPPSYTGATFSEVPPSPAPAPIVPPKSPTEDTAAYTVSVEDVRERLRELQITKSKDTIQRYCREGALDCRKLGLLNRYYTTTTSLEQLIETMHPTAAKAKSLQEHAGAGAASEASKQAHEAAIASDTAHDIELHAGVDQGTQVHADAHDSTETDMQVHAGASAVLQAKLDAANDRINDLKEQNAFLQEEVREARGNRRDVTTIAERMLGTLESNAGHAGVDGDWWTAHRSETNSHRASARSSLSTDRRGAR
mgnify:CR=1 FL=1